MLTIGDKFPQFNLKATVSIESVEKAFLPISNDTYKGKWLLVFFYPKDFTFVCPTEIAAYAALNRDFEDRDAVVLGGSTDNEFCKLAWRRDHKDLNKLPQWSFADTGGVFARALGVLDHAAHVALRATLIVDPDGVVQHITVNGLNVGRSPQETLRVLDGLQTDELCACNRPLGGETIAA